MNKMIKKLAAGAMAAAVVLGGVATSPVSVKAADSYNAYLMFADGSWLWSNWDETVGNTAITGDGTYTVTLNASDVDAGGTDAAAGAVVFCVDVVGINLDDDGNMVDNTITLDDVHVYADGTEISVDTSLVLDGDIEEKGNYRIEIYNDYGETIDNSPIDKDGLTWSESLSVTFTISNTGLTSSDSSDDADAADSSDDADAADSDDADAADSDDADAADSSDDADADDSSSSSSDDSSSSSDKSTETGDVAPIAAVVILLAGCAVILVAAKKRAA